MLQKIRFFDKKDPTLSISELLSWMTIFKSIQMAFYVNPSIICCCQVQDYIYGIISTENDHRHHHKFIKYEKRLRKEGKNMFGWWREGGPQS
jgi:hypothetical protein